MSFLENVRKEKVNLIVGTWHNKKNVKNTKTYLVQFKKFSNLTYFIWKEIIDYFDSFSITVIKGQS